jgi:hypothetical protein
MATKGGRTRAPCFRLARAGTTLWRVAGSRRNQNAASLIPWVEETLGAELVHPPESVATLWAGYGRIVRFYTREAEPRSVVLKQIRFPSDSEEDLGHARKVRSYQVERTFYERFARLSRERSAERARTPRLLGAHSEAGQLWLLLEDLDAAGFSGRPRSGQEELVSAGLDWLAEFHAAHLGRTPDGLWSEGSYWQLATRPDELGAILGHPLHSLAPKLDASLRGARYRTLVHGDPKLENFCATRGARPRFAAVDFQYVGGGVGVRDLVYFIGSAIAPRRVEQEMPRLLNQYFAVLRRELEERGESAAIFAELEAEWRELVPVAWLDFYRFTLGWSPSWAKSDVYAERLLAMTAPAR